jgi:hypothetical protein
MEERKQPRPTTPAGTRRVLHRLAALAHERGLTLTQAAPGVWFCTSASSDQPHDVTGLSCDCRGGTRRVIEQQRCTHAALLLAHLGWLPAVGHPEGQVPTPLTPASCVRCDGVGTVEQFSAARGWAVIDGVPCPACQIAA